MTFVAIAQIDREDSNKCGEKEKRHATPDFSPRVRAAIATAYV